MPARQTYQSYKVVKGDTLAAIARKFGSTVSAIATASGIADPNKIKTGQTLFVPGGSRDVDADALDEVQVTPSAVFMPAVSSAPKSDPRASAELVTMDVANYIAEWMKPPRLWITLAVAAGVGYYLLAEKPARGRR